MAAVEFTNPVNHCRWAMGRRKDGTKYRYKISECHSVVCKYSVDYGKVRCDCDSRAC